MFDGIIQRPRLSGERKSMRQNALLERLPRQIAAEGILLLVVIDQSEARIYRTELLGSMPERIIPFHPQGNGRHLRSIEDDSNSQCQPARAGFYEAVARSLEGAGKILLFGTGSGASGYLEQLLVELQRQDADVALHVVGSVAVDERHLTEDQLLAKARAFYRSASNKPKSRGSEFAITS
jgi:hypothetical protein